ncbi:MAG TPA: 4Fe-4S dicluster domain-containing protein [Armatimonadetes bacterium]|nr:4Fe-4S dicluster domain-containing protein [Armatimonadota bacterium]
MRIEDRLFLNRFLPDDRSHLVIREPENCRRCERKQCTYTCPARVYTWEGERIQVAYEGCLECGTCRIVCNEFHNIDWHHPRGGFGVVYRQG